MSGIDRVREQVTSNPVLLYMKGTPQFPMCGFSSRTAEALKRTGVEFAYFNVLSDPEIFAAVKEFGQWPTYPQLYIKGELVGGCDITLELFESGELEKMVKSAVEA